MKALRMNNRRLQRLRARQCARLKARSLQMCRICLSQLLQSVLTFVNLLYKSDYSRQYVRQTSVCRCAEDEIFCGLQIDFFRTFRVMVLLLLFQRFFRKRLRFEIEAEKLGRPLTGILQPVYLAGCDPDALSYLEFQRFCLAILASSL